MIVPCQADSFVRLRMDSGATAASQATVLAAAESAAAQVTDGLFLDLDTLWSFVHEARHSLCSLSETSKL